jgi:type IV secretion system protein VirB3
MSGTSPQEEGLERHVLHVAATRPAMIWGIPFTIIVPVVVACLELEFILGWRMALILDPPLIVAAIALVKYDYNAPRLWWIWCITKARLLDDFYYGGTAASAFPLKPKLRFRPAASRGTPSNAW